ncbi:SURF1 family cytochrome oxidase biogenesis protein [Caulobacter sp.]|jgi:surfeit locus 1 family protein|uniref:SURF1 family protein n=1 Tax=Caulobacter sp. TaxID=78 RepID=UPI0031DE21A1
MSENPTKKPGFPIGLTIAVGISFVILCGLGTWQMQRLRWKEDLLVRLEKLKAAPAVPLAPVLAASAKGDDVSWTRVETDCGPAKPDRVANLPLTYAVREGQMVWRPTVTCELSGAVNDVILIDLGVIDALTGNPNPAPVAYRAPGRVVGVLVQPEQMSKERRKTLLSVMGENPSSYILMAEQVSPKVDGVTVAPLPVEISNRHLEYALTWFGLAVTLLFIYAAMLWRRLRP